MTPLTIESLFATGHDAEKNQYLVMAALKNYRESFNQNKLFPALSELISLITGLQGILEQKEFLERGLRRQISGAELNGNGIINELPAPENNPDGGVFDFIHWALPELQEVMEEGKAIFDFVDENIKIREIGVIPLYKQEGYLIIPDIKNSTLEILLFELSLYTASGEEMRLLKTRIVKEYSLYEKQPEEIKIDLIQENTELPNPATFGCETELDFPFKETLMPVAKRKLISKLAA